MILIWLFVLCCSQHYRKQLYKVSHYKVFLKTEKHKERPSKVLIILHPASHSGQCASFVIYFPALDIQTYIGPGGSTMSWVLF